ncbi:hypothetical protein H0H81_012252 [Sphagnurus paluster]|uniref:non-reducing end alpha-L-arabinofuranosidase n=1 Tax=Sphagnurus paluster TaxID=117069 RepID=A0A9P7KKE2_9AGAR|nr:hypothetical protein H0H81_012252 [Sphagnurus paluster]
MPDVLFYQLKQFDTQENGGHLELAAMEGSMRNVSSHLFIYWGIPKMSLKLVLQNRAFQKVTPNTNAALLAWHPINAASLNVVAGPDPLSSALPNFLRVTVPETATGAVGFGNEGFWGIHVNTSWTYDASFYYRFPSATDKNVTLTVGLQTSKGQNLASSPVTVLGSQTTWTQIKTKLTPDTSPPSTANNFTITLDGAEAAGLAVDFSLLSLFPPTFKGRENGMRIDIAENGESQALAEMKPAFFRFPGGNNLEGQTTDTRWQWNATVGPLTDRPGRPGDWTYTNTDGLGLYEYLLLCEDLEMEPIMGVWSGYSLGGTSVTGAALAPYIQQAIDQINFVIGDPATSAPAALRAALGHPKPFYLRYVEIGNEDNLGKARGTYQNRWNLFVTKLKATFPQLRAVGEAAFMTGLERNADIVFAAAYAPLLATPNLVNFDSNTVHRSTSFYVQKMFSLNKGDEYLPSTLPTATGTLFWSVTRRISTNEIIIKVSNNAGTTADMSFVLPAGVSAASTAKAEILTGPTGASNSPATPNVVVPYTITLPAGETFNYTAPALSVSVLTLAVE